MTIHILRLSNRGSHVDGLRDSTTWTQNLPSSLRSKGECTVTVLDACASVAANVFAVAIDSNIPVLGSDVETQSTVQRLCTLTQSPDASATADRLLCLNNQHSFRCGGLPERVSITRSQPVEWPDGGGVAPATLFTPTAYDDTANYIEILLEIRFDDCGCSH